MRGAPQGWEEEAVGAANPLRSREVSQVRSHGVGELVSVHVCPTLM